MPKMDGGSRKRAAKRGAMSMHQRTMGDVTKATNAMPAGTTPGAERKGRSMGDVTMATNAKPC